MMMLVFRGGKLAAVQDREGGKAGGETVETLGPRQIPFLGRTINYGAFWKRNVGHARTQTVGESWGERITQFRSVGMVGDKRTSQGRAGREIKKSLSNKTREYNAEFFTPPKKELEHIANLHFCPKNPCLDIFAHSLLLTTPLERGKFLSSSSSFHHQGRHRGGLELSLCLRCSFAFPLLPGWTGGGKGWKGKESAFAICFVAIP